MMKNKLLGIIFFIFIFSTQVHSQEYINSIGLRGGLSQGVTYKHFFSTTEAFDGILAMRWEGFYITGLYEIHAPAFDVDDLFFYYGGGAHIGFWDGNANPWLDHNRGYTILGIDGVIGMEYVFQEIPFNIGLDWKPGFNIIGVTGFWGDELALSFRFIF